MFALTSKAGVLVSWSPREASWEERRRLKVRPRSAGWVSSILAGEAFLAATRGRKRMRVRRHVGIFPFPVPSNSYSLPFLYLQPFPFLIHRLHSYQSFFFFSTILFQYPLLFRLLLMQSCLPSFPHLPSFFPIHTMKGSVCQFFFSISISFLFCFFAFD